MKKKDFDNLLLGVKQLGTVLREEKSSRKHKPWRSTSRARGRPSTQKLG